jgi:hypothetical protein
MKGIVLVAALAMAQTEPPSEEEGAPKQGAEAKPAAEEKPVAPEPPTPTPAPKTETQTPPAPAKPEAPPAAAPAEPAPAEPEKPASAAEGSEEGEAETPKPKPPRRRKPKPPPEAPQAEGQPAAPQVPAPAAPPARPAPPAEPARPPPKLAKPAPIPPGDRAAVALAAARFFDALMDERLPELAALCRPNFSFDGQAAGGPEDLRRRWTDLLATRTGSGYRLQDLDVLTAAEAIAQHGPPPKRLAAHVRPGTWVAVANLSGRATIVTFARGSAGWQATALHD